MASYILQVSLCWLGFYLVYQLFLSKITFFQLNRWFLLITLMLGLLIPLVDPFPGVEAGGTLLVSTYLEPVTIQAGGPSEVSGGAISTGNTWNWYLLFIRVYYLGVLVALVHFMVALFQLLMLYRSAEKRHQNGYRLALTSKAHLPFSFFNVLFWSQQHQVHPKDQEHIIQHELAHIRDRHSLDVIILELLSIFMWCSPLIYLYRRALRTTHEYLADAAVLQKIRPKTYGHLLIRQSQSGPQIALANHFIHSQLKKRFIMMKKRKSKRQVLSRYILLVPMMFLMTYLFSKNFTSVSPNALDAIETIKQVLGEADEMPRFPGCEAVEDAKERNGCANKKLFSFIQENLKYPEAAEKANVEGKVVISFVVEANGTLTNIEIVKDIGYGCGDAAVGVLKAMPNWIPGKKDGEAVAVEMKLPFTFKLKTPTPTSADAVAEPDQFPIFPGCAKENTTYEEQAVCSKQAIVEHIFGNIKYPEDAKKQGVEGMVVASFVVGTNGKVRDLKVERSLHPSCDKVVLETIKKTNDLPQAWTPGQKDDKVVATVMTLPVKFALPADEKPEQTKAQVLELSRFKAAPNPSNGLINLNFNADPKPTQIKILDLNGKTVYQQRLNDFDGVYNQQINLEQAPKGTVILQISQGEAIFTKKLLLQ